MSEVLTWNTAGDGVVERREARQAFTYTLHLITHGRGYKSTHTYHKLLFIYITADRSLHRNRLIEKITMLLRTTKT